MKRPIYPVVVMLIILYGCCSNEGSRLANPAGEFTHSQITDFRISAFYDEIVAIAPNGDRRNKSLPDSNAITLYLSPHHDQTEFVFAGSGRSDTLVIIYERKIGHENSFCGMEINFRNIRTERHTFASAYCYTDRFSPYCRINIE